MKSEPKFGRAAMGGMLCSLMLVAGSLTLVAPAQAQPAAATNQSPEAYKPRGGLVLTLGDFEVFALIDDEFETNPGAGNRTAADWQAHRHLLTPAGKVRGAMGGHLIRNKTNKRLILVDAGMGPRPVPGMKMQASMLKELAALGYKPEDITDVIFTHLHADHSGWAAVGGKPTFPNATYRCHQAEWDHWVKSTPTSDDWMKETPKPVIDYFIKSAAEFVKPVESKLETYKGESMTLFPGLTLRHAPGHTPGGTIIQLDSKGERALLLGDAVAGPLDLTDKSWYKMHYDTSSAQAVATRNALIDEIVKDDIPVAGNHFSGMRFGHLVMTGKGLRFYYNEVPLTIPGTLVIDQMNH